MADLKPDTTPQPPLKKDKTIEDLLNKDSKMMRSPALWFVLLAVPLVFAFYAAMKADSAPDTTSPVISYAPPGALPQEGEPGWKPEDAGLISRRGGAPDCEYEEWVGKKADDALQAELKAQEKAFRILPPGSMMTMDFSPDRVNLDVDADGVITRVWCG